MLVIKFIFKLIFFILYTIFAPHRSFKVLQAYNYLNKMENLTEEAIMTWNTTAVWEIITTLENKRFDLDFIEELRMRQVTNLKIFKELMHKTEWQKL